MNKKFNIKEWRAAQTEPNKMVNESVNDQAIKEFGDLLKLLLNQSKGRAIEKAILDLPPVKAKSLRNQITFLYKQLAKLHNSRYGTK